MKFTKLQSAGNDFVLIETTDFQEDWPSLAVEICRRRFGVGADGLLLLLPSDKADMRMRIFNADGSESEACGNGLRCLLRYAVDQGLIVGDSDVVSVETVAGIRQAKLIREDKRLIEFQVSMGRPRLAAKDIPVALEAEGGMIDIKYIADYPLHIEDIELSLSFVNMGNPHAVYFWQLPVAGFPMARIGPQIESHKIFPDRVNFEIAQIINRCQIEVRVWERGLGETMACGSGACAVAVAARLQGYIDDSVEIILPGGVLEVVWDGKGEVMLCGPAERIYDGQCPSGARGKD